jgi:hypothetical protein
MRKNRTEVIEYINGLKEYEGYVQFSHRAIDLDKDIFPKVEDIDEVDDEKIIRFKLGRYRFGIDADHFYAWEEEKVKELGSNSPTVIVYWIKDQLGLRG